MLAVLAKARYRIAVESLKTYQPNRPVLANDSVVLDVELATFERKACVDCGGVLVEETIKLPFASTATAVSLLALIPYIGDVSDIFPHNSLQYMVRDAVAAPPLTPGALIVIPLDWKRARKPNG